jgi:hypothetical protein
MSLPFRDVFEGMLKTKPFDEFESLILRKRWNIQHFVNTNFSAEKHIQLMFVFVDFYFDDHFDFDDHNDRR